MTNINEKKAVLINKICSRKYIIISSFYQKEIISNSITIYNNIHNYFKYSYEDKLIYKNNNYNKNKYNIKLIEGILKYLIVLSIFISSLSNAKRNIFSFNNIITLKINNIGNWSIYYNNLGKTNFPQIPDEIYINGNIQNIIRSFHVFNQTENTILLIWKDNLNTTASMFYNCKVINEIDLSHFDTSQVTDMNRMFWNCVSLTSLNLKNINTSKVTNMNTLFGRYEKLTSIDLSNFDTSQVINMEAMFYGCETVTTLDLSNFDTSRVSNMVQMFCGCENIKSLYLSNFDTSQVTTMKWMFEGNYYVLQYIDLSSFNTSKVTDMYGMFSQVHALTSLNLSNFDTSKVTNMFEMFENCYNLRYLDLSNFDTSKVTNMYGMFANNRVITSLNLSNFDTSNVKNINGMFNGCNNLKYLDLSNFNTLNATYISNFFSGCSSLKYINLQNAKINNTLYIFNNLLITYESLIICSNNDLKLNSTEIYINCNNDSNIININNKLCFIKSFYNEYNKYLCDICNYNYYQSYNDSNIINCYKIPDGFYLDKNEVRPYPKPCYSSCKLCDKEGNKDINNCLECKENYESIHIISNYYNCICNNYYYIDDETNNTVCLPNKNCPDNYKKIIINKSECIDNCNKDPIFSYEYNKICYDKYSYKIINKSKNSELAISYISTDDIIYNSIINESTTSEITETNKIIQITEINKYNKIINNSEEISNIIIQSYKTNLNIINESIPIYNDINIYNKAQFEDIKNYLLNSFNKNYLLLNDYDIQIDNFLLTLSTTETQRNNLNKNKTSIELGQCENKLKEIYNISINNSLFILKLEYKEKGMKIPKIEYELYYPLYSESLFKLNLSICKNMQIDISIPISINGDISLYNQSSNYYNDICSKAISDFGTDISLFDRKNLFVENNMTLCEEDCRLIDYNYTTEKAKCSCLIKINFPFMDSIKFDKDKLLKSFIDIKNFANIKFMKCYKSVLKAGNLKKNIGFYIYIFLFVIYFLSLILFYSKYYFDLINDIDQIIEAKNKILEIKRKYKNKLKQDENNIVKMKKKKRKRNKKRTLIPLKNKKETDLNNIQIPINIKNEDENNEIQIPIISSNNPIRIETNNKVTINSLLKKDEIYLKYKEILKLTDNELNSFSYNKSLIHDKRTCLKYYISLLKTKHSLFFSFNIKNKDYNSPIIKILLFFFDFCLFTVINALFFNDSTLHRIYLDEGSFNLIYQISQIIYSSIISTIISLLIKYLALSEKNILELKNEKKIGLLNTNISKTKQYLKVKFVLFFVLSFLLLFLFLYYITCFCGIYTNTQFHLIKDSVISFGLSLIYPLGLLIIPAIFRIIALNDKNKGKKYIFKLSQFIQDLL